MKETLIAVSAFDKLEGDARKQMEEHIRDNTQTACRNVEDFRRRVQDDINESLAL